MEFVAATKMKRAVVSTLASRLYAEYSWEILASIAENVEELDHPLFNERNKKDITGKILLILIASNRGLCGAYNAQIIKKTIFLLKNFSAGKNGNNIGMDAITIGKKGDIAMRRLGVNVIASFANLSDKISLSEIIPISKLIIDEYTAFRYDKVLVAYTDFVSTLIQKPNIKQILPVNKTDLKELIENLAVGLPSGSRTTKWQAGKKTNYLFEGDKVKLISALAEKLTRMQIYQMILESNASEQSSRMVAMKNASDASGEMINDLTLVFNKARQANITREISEISAGMASIS